MKHYILFFSILSFFTSCENDTNSRITTLELEIEKLIDSINNLELQKLTSLKIVATPENKSFRVNETGKINFAFQYVSEIQNYNVYKIDRLNNARELIIENNNVTYFSYDFIPKSSEEENLEFEAVIETKNNEEIYFPIDLKIDIQN
jgi:hypothetical protein